MGSEMCIRDRSNWVMSAASNANSVSNMLDNTGLSLTNYDATLTGWSSQSLQTGLTFGAAGLSYCASDMDRASIINTSGWTFAGDTLDCSLSLDPISDISNTLEFYPNPSNSFVNFSKNLEKVSVYSISGMKLKTVFQSSKIDISDLEVGLYYFVAENIGTISATQIMKY